MVTENISIPEGIFGRQPNDQAMSSGRKNKQLQYWRKCTGRHNGNICSIHRSDLGWITTGPVMTNLTAIEYTEFMASKHATPLPQYGQYEVGIVPGQEFDLTGIEHGISSRYKAIVFKNGIKEFPLDQMIAYNWHRIEPIREAFPALKEVVDISCTHCPDRLFTQQKDLDTHTSIMHKESAAPEAIGNAIKQGMETVSGLGQMTPEFLTQLSVAIATAIKASNSEPTS
jgi:hypothetical protein